MLPIVNIDYEKAIKEVRNKGFKCMILFLYNDYCDFYNSYLTERFEELNDQSGRKIAFITHYAYIDVAEYYADEYLRKRKIHIKFGQELSHPDHGYRIILCKIPKWQEHQFVLSMEELKNKMLICGHADYLDFCKDLRDKMRAVNNGSGSDGQT